MQNTHQTQSFATLTQGGMLCNFSKSSFWGYGFLKGKGWRWSPPPLPSPFSCEVAHCPGAGAQLGKKRGRGGGEKFQSGHRTLLAPLCHHPFLFSFIVLHIVLIVSPCLIYNMLSATSIPSQHVVEALMPNTWVLQMQHRTPIWIGTVESVCYNVCCTVAGSWQVHTYITTLKKSMQHTTPKPAFCDFDTGGNAVHFFKI